MDANLKFMYDNNLISLYNNVINLYNISDK